MDTLLAGDVETGKSVLRDYINATMGFAKLGVAVGVPAKSLIRMFGPRGNPQARTGVRLRVAASRFRARRLAAA